MLSKVQNMFLFRVLARPLAEQSVNDSALPERRLSVTDLSSEITYSGLKLVTDNLLSIYSAAN